ncbi:Gsf2 protein [Martiniozyma asiatica (nom. inval.)]|nr:Gsf2 protein [Martiniozyma asiatica]
MSEAKEIVDECGIDESKFDVFIRMKASADNDYCFQVTKEKTFKGLIDIFTEMPVVLSPSIFYNRIPVGFKVSKYPGKLTRTGGILFGYEADFKENLEAVPIDGKISDFCLPGQLIVPVFPERKTLHLSLLAIIAVWLYTDLPDFISPTPGLCLTNQATKAIVWFLREILQKPVAAQKFWDDIFAPTGIVGQCIYFVFHIVKLTVLYFIFWAGLFNPYRFFGQRAPEVTRETLINIGWTGSKRGNESVYQDKYRNLQVQKLGGILKVYSAGLFSKIRICNLELNKGEGFDSDFKDDSSKDGKFILSWDLIQEQNQYFAESLKGCTSIEMIQRLKEYRQVGPLDPCPRLEKLVNARFATIDAEMKNENEKKND